MPARHRLLYPLHTLMVASLLTLATTATLAFDADSDTPIKVEADNARLDDRAGTATYTGNVIITQGETRLTADKIVLERGAEGLDRITAHGEPAYYEQAARNGDPALNAEANIILYSRIENTLTFERNARIEQEGDTFRGNIIRYDTLDRVVTASGGEADDPDAGRVEMVIQPRRSEREAQ